ncbi:divalent metal cation transporter [Rheinheimera sp. 1928-s]|uniref:NRAMP family divalent metal transporter n=1 Tax=Rheinheimera sp. 1928-s TaxID=3033803 RepID=UPI002621DD43|nr:divalent metal cation transporter [Rheinheimera sp. 1928-s]MDF3125013.1 divalent metal cation transporter [Rheinheimera sp. 1928-s]
MQQGYSSNWHSRLKALGPGVLLATAAIGGSHIVASTQAGALFGWQLAVLILLVNVLKYPFFRFGVEYSLQSGETLLEGYKKQGRGYLLSFVWLNLIAAVVNTAGVLLLTASLLQLFLPVQLSLTALCLMLLVVCLLILLAGRYKLLDSVSKWVMVLLTITTVAAAIIAFNKGATAAPDFVGPSPWQLMYLGFLVALMGWMPAPIEISAINSLWLKAKQQHTAVSKKDGLFDFNLGYWSTTALALVFLSLGALVQYGSDQKVELAGAAYTSQFVAMYASTIGDWSRLLVAFVAFLCMFGTTLTVLDGYARTINESFQLLGWQKTHRKNSYNLWLLAQAASGMAVILFFKSALGPMLTFAMSLAFVTTPIFAWLNYRLMRGQQKHLMQPWIRLLSWLGLTYLFGFSLLFIWWFLSK